MTVDALVEATARVLVREGYDRASTNRIAAVAGVCIGSLYQYFPNKEALVAAVSERHSRELAQVASNALLRAAARPIEIAAREFVTAAIEGHRVNPKLHRVLAEEVPRTGRPENADAVQESGRALIRGYLEAHRSEIDIADLDLAAFILVTAVEALTHTAVLHRQDILADELASHFVESGRAVSVPPSQRAGAEAVAPSAGLNRGQWPPVFDDARMTGRRAWTTIVSCIFRREESLDKNRNMFHICSYTEPGTPRPAARKERAENSVRGQPGRRVGEGRKIFFIFSPVTH